MSTDNATTRRDRARTRRIHSLMPAEPGWRVLVQHRGMRPFDEERRLWLPLVYHDGDWRRVPEVDLEAVPTYQLGAVLHLIAWALIEEWTDEVDHGYEPLGSPNEESYEHGRHVEPVVIAANMAEVDYECPPIVELLPPGVQLSFEQVRERLIGAWRADWERG